MKTVDVGAVLDEGRWTGYQKLLIFGTALTIILDGVDNQLLPNTIPALDRRMGQHAARRSRNALAIGPVRHDDRRAGRRRARRSLGRRTALLGSVITFAVLTIAIAFVNSHLDMLGAAAVPRRRRPRRRDAQRRDARLRVRAAPAAPVRRDADDRLHSARRLRRRARWRSLVPGAIGWRALFMRRRRRAARPRRAALEGAARVAALSRQPPGALARADGACCGAWATTCPPT